jgi:hypothetical protein
LGGLVRAEAKLYGASAPLALANYLRDNPPRGLVLNPQAWGDWLIWRGPPGIELFVTSDVQRIPRQVWQDYRQVAFGQSGWQRVLDRYAASTLIVDLRQQPVLARIVRRADGWQLRYEDNMALVLVRDPGGKRASQVAGNE